jgi:glycosyltransferase involved in cell wall biosynthesis
MTELEIWVSDNASTDETADVVASFDDPRIRYAPLERDIGLYGNLSRGLRLGTAPYLTLVPDDALMHPRNLERKVALMQEDDDVDLVHSAARVHFLGPEGRAEETTSNGGLSDTIALERGARVVHRLLTEPYGINITTALMRRSLVADDGFAEADGPPADLGLALRLARRARLVAYLPEPLITCRAHPDDASVKEYGIWDVKDGEHRYAFTAVALNYKVKERFVAEHARDDPDLRRLGSTVRRLHGRSLLYHLRTAGGVDRSRRATWRLLREAYRADPRLFPPVGAARFLAGGLLGPQGRDAVRLRRASRHTRPGGSVG